MQGTLPGTCDYVTLPSKRDFANATKLKLLRWGLARWPSVITEALSEGRRRVRVTEAHVTIEAEIR